jgi:hypothetical protein
MSLISEGISGVEVFGLPVGVFEDGSSIDEPKSVLVKWKSAWDDKLYQVYVNGRFVFESEFAEQRQAVISFENQFGSVVRFEVFAVEISDSGKDHSGDIENIKGDEGRLDIRFLKKMVMPYKGKAEFYICEESGDIFDEDNLAGMIELWSNEFEKCGFGMSGFGEGDLGYDGGASLGFGRGVFGENEYGFDFGLVSFRSEQLLDGDYIVGIKIKDEFDNESFFGEVSDSVRVIRAGQPAGSIEVSEFDVNENKLILSVT